MITNIRDWRIFEKKQKNAGIDLVVVDVQESFRKYFGDAYLESLNEYCEDFQRVFQIWDNHDADKPDFVFPNQVKTYEKHYNGKLRISDVEQFFPEPMWSAVKNKLENVPNAGDIFETMYGDVWCYIGNGVGINEDEPGHEWFLCPKDIVSLIKSFVSQERQVMLVGGAAKECLTDIYTVMKSYGVNATFNQELVYSAQGSKFAPAI